jgi:glycosyltransferase involved in cell wall biosynthesis
MEAVGKKRELLLFIEKLTYACATKIYPNSNGLEEYILQNSLTTPEKLKVIGYGSSNGIDTDYFSKSKEVLYASQNIAKDLILKDKFTFCFVGRVVKDKGINELLYAFNALTKEYDNIALLLVGGFEEKLDPISQESQEILQSNSSICHVGFVDDIRPYLAISDLFVLPTYREGFPNVVLQASAMGLASIVTNINGCNEIIKDEYNGLLVEPKDKEALLVAMKMFLHNRDLATTLSLNSRSDIMQKYDRKVFHNYLLNEYKDIINA